jgi:hypothetical protein
MRPLWWLSLLLLLLLQMLLQMLLLLLLLLFKTFGTHPPPNVASFRPSGASLGASSQPRLRGCLADFKISSNLPPLLSSELPNGHLNPNMAATEKLLRGCWNAPPPAGSMAPSDAVFLQLLRALLLLLMKLAVDDVCGRLWLVVAAQGALRRASINPASKESCYMMFQSYHFREYEPPHMSTANVHGSSKCAWEQQRVVAVSASCG